MHRFFTPRHRAASIAVLTLIAGVALASSFPYNFTYFGNFKRMSHSGDTSGKVKLNQVPTAPGTWGVGALAGLKGEVLVADGKVLVSRGHDAKGSLEPAKADDEAVLFASATITVWDDILVARDMNQTALEAFVLEQAKIKGVDIEQPFAFLVDGHYPDLRWHVVTGEKPAGHGGGHAAGGHANHASGMREFQNPDGSGRLVGIYSGKELEGVVTHPNERFHLHFVDKDHKVSGHVDAYAVRAGAIVRLPSNRK